MQVWIKIQESGTIYKNVNIRLPIYRTATFTRIKDNFKRYSLHNISCHIRYQCSIAVNKKMCEGFDKNFYKNIERFVKIEN